MTGPMAKFSPRRRAASWGALALLVCSLGASALAFADLPSPKRVQPPKPAATVAQTANPVPAPPPTPGPSVVVARVGEQTITSDQVEKLAKSIPPYQLKRMGTAEEVARKITESLVAQLLAEQGAMADELHERLDVAQRIRSIYGSALLQDVQQNASEAAVTDAEIEAFYEANREHYRSEERIRVWQIVVATEAEAKAILKTIKSDAKYAEDPVKAWDELARTKSLDKGTAMRKGDLGFMRPDGSTAHRDVAFPAEVYAAVAKIQDGEVVAEPVKIQNDWLILQRRGSVKTPERSLEQEKATIRGMLAKKKVRDVGGALITELRGKHLTDHHPQRVDIIQIDGEGDLAPMERPGALQAKRPAQPAAPKGTPGNLR